MTSHPSLLSLVVVGYLSAVSASAQTLELTFHGHDGASAEEAVFPVLATGNLVGALHTQEGPASVEYVTAYYSASGHVLYSETGPNIDDRAYFVFRPQDHVLRRDSDGSYELSLPIGSGGAQLPVGSFTLRLWAGAEGSMQFDPATGVPTSGYLFNVTCPVTVQNVVYGVYVPDPRGLHVNTVVPLRILTATPVTSDVYFRVYAPSALGSLSVTQVMIPSGQTCSAEFTLTTAKTPLTQGQLVAIDNSGEDYRSSMLQLILPTRAGHMPGNDPPIPEIDQWAFCASEAGFKTFGEMEQVCGLCAKYPASPTECHQAPGASQPFYWGPTCQDWLWDECEYFLEQHQNVPTYSATNTYNQSCGGTAWTYQGGGGAQR